MRKDAILRALVEKNFLKKTKEFMLRYVRYMGEIPSKVGIFFATNFNTIDDNKIIFVTSTGRYDCNPKWIVEELRRRNSGYVLVWAVRNDHQGDVPKDVTCVVQGSYDFYRQISSAKIIVDNSVRTAYLNYKKKKEQILIETWHGSLGIKKFSKETNADQDWCRKASWEGATTDYCLSNSSFEDKIFTDTFWSNARILQLGHARNDVLCWQDAERLDPIREKVYTHFNLKGEIAKLKRDRKKELVRWYQEKIGIMPVSIDHLDKENPFDSVDIQDKEALRSFFSKEYARCEDLRICLYAPTFRDDEDLRPYKIDYKGLRQALQSRFGGNWVIMTRFHFKLRKKLKNYKYPAGVVNASKYSDIQELLTCTDVGITDYSSWICDYMLTRRPGFLFATDMEEYEEKDREFFYPLDSMPFPLALNNEQLIQNILDFDKDNTFAQECDAFLKDKGCMDDGHAAERIADAIEKMFKGERL